jgi:putative SOS response-associated peptidase YedK
MNGRVRSGRGAPSSFARGKAVSSHLRGYGSCRDHAGGEVDTVAIITCATNATVTPLHDRMPVVLPPECFEGWLDCEGTTAEAACELLQPAPDDLLEAIEMHPKLNDSRSDEPSVQEPLQASLL